jgi:23S rRNA (uracil1939-C5)-methyltransferase
MNELRELLITRVGAQGDGVADDQGAAVFVPFALAGERVAADVSGERARLLEVLQPSDARVKPVCRHFGVCGGCSVQHMAPQSYRAWKRDSVVAAFRASGLDIEVAPLISPGGKRRRAVFTMERTENGIVVGFHEAASHAIVAIEECPVLEPKIVAALPALTDLLAPLLSKRGDARLTVLLTNSGLDVRLDGTARQLTSEVSSRLALGASALPPFLTFGTVDVTPPSGVFVQAVAEAERENAGLIIAAVGKAKAVADLFCGMGAFTFPLAAKARVSAFDGDREAITTLEAAARKATGLKPITARVRDLFREPLSALELNEHDAVVFDPPRVGAEAQAKKLARSKVKTVVAVSCNPATLTRDARHLIDGGYKLESVTPIDQFVYSAHVEVVAVFRR